MVLNGVELGSGSMRIHQKDVQRKMFEALGFSEEQIQERFGFMVNAFQYGTPPHGGFAFGLDRLAMQMLEAESLRDVIAFPKNKDAVCPMTQAPNVVDPQQLEVLGLAALLSKEGTGKAVQKRQRPKIDVENVANLSKLLLSPEEKELRPRIWRRSWSSPTSSRPSTRKTYRRRPYGKADKCVPGGYPADVLSPAALIGKRA